VDDAEEQPLYCGGACAAAVQRFAARLGNGALALDRFTAMYDLVQQQKAQQRQQQAAGMQQSPGQQPPSGWPARQQQHGANGGAATAAPAGPGTAAGAPPSAVAGMGPARGGSDSDPGGIGSSVELAPRLAVEQVEVKHIASSAGQFGDFSRKPAPRRAAAEGGEAATVAPRGVLKKQSRFAAGTPKVPIMLAEVKVRAWLTRQGRVCIPGISCFACYLRLCEGPRSRPPLIPRHCDR
jgi:hypothetical protein